MKTLFKSLCLISLTAVPGMSFAAGYIPLHNVEVRADGPSKALVLQDEAGCRYSALVKFVSPDLSTVKVGRKSCNVIGNNRVEDFMPFELTASNHIQSGLVLKAN